MLIAYQAPQLSFYVPHLLVRDERHRYNLVAHYEQNRNIMHLSLKSYNELVCSARLKIIIADTLHFLHTRPQSDAWINSGINQRIPST